jgi:hypothetical protein
VGLVPGYDSIGIWGAISLTVNNRGFIASWPQFGGPAGLFLANLAVLVFSWISGDQFLVWGWRIPFFISIIMVGMGQWIPAPASSNQGS